MTFQIAQVDSFSHQLALAPKPVQNTIRKRVIPELRVAPDRAQPPKIKRLKGYKGLWRYRVNDTHRLVYRVHASKTGAEVVFLLLGHRKDVYERLGANADGTPGIRIVASGIDDLLEVEPTPQQIGEAIISLSHDEQPPASPDNPLPLRLTTQLLKEWEIPEEHHERLTAVSTEHQLLSARVPGWVAYRVMNGLWPPKIEETLQEPLRVVPEDLGSPTSADSDSDLAHLLLKLDEEQKSFVSRFQQPEPQGPWLLKGGPGSGKSVVALYCIKALIDEQSSRLPGQQRSLKILLTTYTNSLANAAEQLSRNLTGDLAEHQIDVRTVNSLASEFSTLRGKDALFVSDPQVREAGQRALQRCKQNHSAFPFENSDITYLLDEIEWVVAGQNCRSTEEYVDKADRQGRQRAFGRRQREAVWAFYEHLTSDLRDRNLQLWVDLERDALSNATPTYDYVFVDEAQDLKPVAVRFLTKLALDPANLFLTADSNQSIYGTGMSWSRLAETVKFSGRAFILKRNYRSTKEIWRAIAQISPDAEDSETSDVEPAYSGPPPILATYPDMETWAQRLNRFFFEAMREEKVGLGACAVLMPQNGQAQQVARLLSTDLNPKAFVSKEVDIEYPGVKVLTIHSAKGLEFPVVAIVANDKFLPGRPHRGHEPGEWEERHHRLLFVAASRAMRQLMILAPAKTPSRFLAGANDEHWQIERL